MNVEGVLRERAESELAALTAYLESRYSGGTPFFDALDEKLRDPYWFRYILLRYMDDFRTRPRPVVSGKFGISFATWLGGSEYGRYLPFALVLPGDLRHKVLPTLNVDLSGHEFAFLDDSYYKGRTYGQIKYRIEEAGGRMLGGLVLYDGSPTPPTMPSFFRYHS